MSIHPHGAAHDAISDAELVRRCRAGEEGAWEAFVGRFARYVHAIATRTFRLDPAAAEDVFQETFLRAYEHLDELRSDEAVRSWLAMLARRLCVDELREGTRTRPSDAELDEARIDESLGDLDEALAVREALATLPEHCRQVLDRFFCRDQSYERIADDLEIPMGTIASRIARCLVHLRNAYEGRDRGPRASSP